MSRMHGEGRSAPTASWGGASSASTQDVSRTGSSATGSTSRAGALLALRQAASDERNRLRPLSKEGKRLPPSSDHCRPRVRLRGARRAMRLRGGGGLLARWPLLDCRRSRADGGSRRRGWQSPSRGCLAAPVAKNASRAGGRYAQAPATLRELPHRQGPQASAAPELSIRGRA